MMGNTLTVSGPLRRIVSVVPSQTELLAEFGLEEEVVGITKFCVHPPRWHQSKTRVGGTKNLNLAKIRELAPDLIIANKEENEKEQIEAIAREFPVFVSDINKISDALHFIQVIGALLDRSEPAARLLDTLYQAFGSLQKGPVRRVAYAIWKDPWMWVGEGNFIGDMIRVMGWVNVLDDMPRYPQCTLEEVLGRKPDLILLSSEPYPFSSRHVEDLKKAYPSQEFRQVDGEMFSWYGSRMQWAVPYMNQLIQDAYGNPIAPH